MNELAVATAKVPEPRLRSILLALAFMLLLAPLFRADAAEGDSKSFKYNKLEFGGTRHDRLMIDVNGDGLADLNMVYSRSDKLETWYFRTCLQEKGTGFAIGKCTEFVFPKEARAFDIGEVNGQPGAEMILITSNGVNMAGFAGGRFGTFTKVLPDRNLFTGTDDAKPALLRCLWDLDNNKIKELILPATDGPAIYRYAGAAFALFQKIKSPAHITYRVGTLGDIMATNDVNQFLSFRVYEKRATASYTAPDVFIEDFNGDRKPDILTLVDNTLRVFPQGADGKFSD